MKSANPRGYSMTWIRKPSPLSFASLQSSRLFSADATHAPLVMPIMVGIAMPQVVRMKTFTLDTFWG